MNTPLRRIFKSAALTALAVCGLAVQLAPLAHAAPRAFAPRYSLNAKGDIVFVSNTNMTCPIATSPCNVAQQNTYSTGGSTNNNYTMQYVDVDGDATTTNSSTATLTIPNGSSIAFAGLYWAGQTLSAPAVTARNTVRFAVPGTPGYQTITASQIDDVGTSPNTSYQGFADVTSIVSAAGAGIYGVANISSSLGANQYAGWTLVVVYTNSAITSTRNLVVYDGYQRVASNTPPINISLSGFITPPFGPVNSKLGVVGYDGDRGSTEGTAGLLFGPDANTLSPVSNGSNPQTDVFNSTISTLGVLNTGRSPDYNNTLGYDADIFAPNTPLPNNANSAAIRVQSSGETIDVGVITLATDIFVPNIKDTLTKSVTKVAGQAGAAIVPGDTLEYVIDFYNAGQDGALNVRLTDPLPPNLSYVAGSLRVTNTPASGPAVTVTPTDALGDDVGEYDGTARRITARVGSGASATQGGTLVPATAPANTPSARIVFRVTVDANTRGGTVIDNTATVTFTQQTLGGTISDASDSDRNQAGDQPTRTVIAGPDVTVTKTANGAFVQGQSGSYTITVANNGPLAQAPTFGTVTMTDTVPTGLTLTALSGTGWTCSVASAICTRSDVLAPGASYPTITATFTVAGDAPASVTNRAAVACACEAAAAQNNNTANAVTPIGGAPALASTKTAVGTFIRGSTGSYTLEVRTTSAGGATNGSTVTVADNLPAGLTLASTPTGSGWTCTGAAGATSFSCTSNATVSPPAAFPLITVNVNVALNAPAEVVNTFTASGGGAITPTSANAITPIAASTDRRVSKSVRNVTSAARNTNPNVGDVLEFTVTATNGGPSIATNVTVTDAINTSQFTFNSATASQGSYSDPTWTIGSMNPNATATLTIRVTVAAPGALSNTATINGTEPDPAAGNNSATVSVQGQSADLSITKTVNNATPNVGEDITFTITVSNAGPSNATGIEVTDLLPLGLTFVSATAASGAYNQSTGLWGLGSLNSAQSTTLTIVAKPQRSGAIINKAEITKADQFDPDSTPNNGVATEDDQAQVTIVAQQADLNIAKSVDNPNPVRGETVVYTVTVSNAGPSTANGVVVSEDIPAGLTLLSATPSQGTFTTPTWTVGSIAAGSRAVLTISARYDGPGRVTNTASITASTTPDPTPNSPSSVTIPSQIADLSLQKTVNTTTPNVGSNVQYTLTLSNAGPDGATGVVVNDLLPAGLAVVSTTPSQGSYDAVSGDWTVGSVANGANATLQITAKVTGLAAITNIAEVKSSRQFDPDSTPNNRVASEDDQASVTIVPQSADLKIAKSVSPQNPTAANPTVTYTIRVSNAGPSTATNIVVAENLPNGVTYNANSANASTGTFNAGTGQWSIPSLANGATATLSFTATATSFGVPLTNSARIVSTDQPDPTPEDPATATVLGQSADLSLAKTASPSAPNVGGNVTFTLTLTNSGPNTATGVKVRDVLPTGLVFVSATPSAGTYDSATGMWDVGAVAYSGSPASVTLQLVARVVQTTAAPIVNRAEVAASDQFDPNSTPNNLPSGENDEASATITPVPQADLTIAKAGPAALNPGASASYDVIVTNLGPSIASSVNVTDPTPAGLTLQTVSGAGCSALPCNVGNLGAGESRTITVTYTVNFPASGASIANTASVSSATADPQPANNSNTLTVPIVRDADVSIEKTGAASVVGGEFADYQLVVRNAGPSTAATVVITDPTPAGFTFVSAGAPCASGFPCTLGDIVNGGSQTIAVRYRVAQNATPGTVTNTASVASTGPNASPDPSGANNSSSVNTTIANPRADLALTKVGPGSVLKGENITYTLTLSNSGPSDAVNVELTDPTPAGLTFVSAAGDCTSVAAGGCVFASLPVGATRTVRVTFTVPLNYGGATNPALIENRAQVKASSDDPNGGDNLAIARTDAITPPPILSVSKTSAASFTRGTSSSYSIVVTVAATGGPTTGATMTVSDTLPNGVTLNGAPTGSGWTCSASGASSFSCASTSVIAAGAQFPAISVPVNVGLGADANVTNTATAEGGGATNPASGSVTTPVNSSADLSIAKAVDRNAPTAASPNVVFTIVAENAGPSTAVATSAQDVLPAGLTFVSATPSLGTYNAGTGAWTIGDLPPGSRATLTLRATVTDFVNPITNTATINSTTTDPNGGNNSASATIRGQVANLSLEKRTSTATPNVQAPFDFTITVRNAGPDAATNVAVSDLLANGLSFISASSAAYDAGTGLWSVGTIAAGSSASLTIRAKATGPEPLVNRAQIARSDQFDPNSSPNNSNASEDDDASVNVFPQQSDVRLAKSVSNPNPRRGDAIAYTIELSNVGPSTATNISVAENTPAGVEITSIVASSGVFDGATNTWGVASLAPGSRATLTISGVFRGPAAQTNTAQITAIDQFDPTPNDPVSVTIPSQIADLSLTKTVDNANPVQGSNVVFTVRLANAGPDRATGVEVSDLLPSGLTFVSATASTGSFDGVSGQWNIGSVDVGATPTLQVTARVDSFAPVTNTARVSASSQYDPDSVPNNDDASEDDQASVVVTPQSADLRISKRANTNSPTVANPNVSFVVEVFNAGPNDASAVSVRDAVPAGMTLTSATASAGNYASGTWTIPSIPANTRATITFNVVVTDFARPITNTAQIIGSNLPDPTPNEQASATVQGQVADLSLTKTTSNATPRVGETITYTIRAANAGPDTATNVSVLDRLPPGLSLENVTASTGSYDAASGVWQVGSLAANANATLTLTARITQTTAAPIVNRAEIRSSDQFDPNSTPNNNVAGENDQADASVTPIPVADLTVAKVPPARLIPGSTATYTLIVKNLGPSTAQAVQLADPGPADLVFQSSSCGSFPCNLGNLQAGEERMVTVVYRVPFPYAGADPQINSASVSASTFDPNTTNNTDRVGASIDARADLQMSKTGPANATAGDVVAFTLTVFNAGPASAGDVAVTDPVQPGISQIVSVRGAGCAQLPCNIGTLAANQSATITVNARIDPASRVGTTVRNVARVSSTTPDPELANNSGAADVLISGAIADLRINKTGPASARPGDTISFTISVQNLGPSDAQSVQITDPTPANFAVTQVTGACIELPCNIATLAANATATLTVTGRVTTLLSQGGAIANVARVTSTNTDPTPDNVSTATVNILPVPDLTVSLSAPPTIIGGDTAPLEVRISNVGGAPTSGPHSFSITLPPGVVLDNNSPTNGYVCTTSGNTLTCTSSAVIAPNATLTLTLTIVNFNDNASFNANVSGGGEVNTTNNTAQTSVASAPRRPVPINSAAMLLMLIAALFAAAFGARTRRA